MAPVLPSMATSSSILGFAEVQSGRADPLLECWLERCPSQHGLTSLGEILGPQNKSLRLRKRSAKFEHVGIGGEFVISFSDRVRIDGRSLWSRNAVKGVSLRGERLKREGKKEWRQWNPRASKLGAGLLKASERGLLPEPGTTCLYLGSGHGTTISHLHDHLCAAKNHLGGTIVAVDISARCIRDLLKLSKTRPGIIPVLGDCRQSGNISPFLTSKVPWLFQDVSQAGQVEMFIHSCRQFLADEGTGILSLKSASERDTSGAFGHAQQSLLDAGFTLVERIDLSGWEDQHVLFHVVC